MEQIKKYIYQVYKDKSFSAAAKALYVSQPALSASIARYEKEIGIKIFDRTKQPISLTAQGIIYIESIEEIMAIEDNIEKRIRLLSDMSYGSLTIGGSSFASFNMMSTICAEFYKKYPKIKVTLDLGNYGKVDFWNMRLKRGEIDLQIITNNEDDRFIYEPLIKEKLVIAMRKDTPCIETLLPYAITHNELVSGTYDKSKEIEDFSIFRDIHFIPFGSSTSEGEMKHMFGDYRKVPYRITNARQGEMHYELMSAGIGAILVPALPIICSKNINEDVLYFVPKGEMHSRTIYFARTSLTDENPIVQNFIRTAKEVCERIHMP